MNLKPLIDALTIAINPKDPREYLRGIHIFSTKTRTQLIALDGKILVRAWLTHADILSKPQLNGFLPLEKIERLKRSYSVVKHHSKPRLRAVDDDHHDCEEEWHAELNGHPDKKHAHIIRRAADRFRKAAKLHTPNTDILLNSELLLRLSKIRQRLNINYLTVVFPAGSAMPVHAYAQARELFNTNIHRFEIAIMPLTDHQSEPQTP